MSIRSHQSIIALSILSLWVFLLGSPWIALSQTDGQKIVKTDQHEQESEGEEWGAEWDETVMASCDEPTRLSTAWHLAGWHNAILNQRLDAARLLDPPDKL